MRAQRLVFSIFVAFLTAFSGNHQAMADDADIYTLPPTFSSAAAPKVLLVFDTSGSMGSDVKSKPKYASSFDYITPFKAVNSSNLQAGRIYWDSNSSGIDVPDDNSDQWVATTNMECQAATDAFALADNVGYFGKGDTSSLIVQHRSNSDQRWTSLASGNTQPIDCIQDSDSNDAQTDRLAGGLPEYLSNIDDSDGYTITSSDRYTWGSNNDSFRVRLYTANYIAYYNDPAIVTTIRARLRVAKEGIQAVIDENPNINFGLMVYNSNNTTPHGGRVVEAVGNPDTEITYEPATIETNTSSGASTIEVSDPRSFSVGENIGIELNGSSGTDWTTVSSIVKTKLTVQMDDSDTTLTVADASIFVAGDDIGIEDNDGFVLWHTISSISGNTITISAQLQSSGSEDANVTQNVWGRKIGLTAALTGNANAGKIVYAKAARREKIKDTVEILVAAGFTPISESTYEAYRYFAGKTVTYGNPSGTQIPPTDLCAQDASCASASGTYISPLKFECEKAYIVMMTDGAPTNDVDEQQYLTTTNFPAIPAATGAAINYNSSNNNNGDGLVPLVEWMYGNDINAGLSNPQTARFYAITFGDGLTSGAQALLDEATQKGTGNPLAVATNASDVTDLKDAFEKIIADISIETASFSAPTLSVNAFNKLYNRDEVYFALFEPGKKYRWNGNMKKYRLCNSDDATNYGCTFGDIIDANNVGVIDLTTKRIKTSAKSFWSSGVDGNTVVEGGAGQSSTALNPDSQRRLFVWQGSYSSATYPETLTQVDDASGNTFYDSVDLASSGNPTLIGLPATATTTDVTNLVGWMMGKDTFDEDGDASTTERWSIADPLHGRPVSITYGAHVSGGVPDYDQPIIKLVMPGNDGAIRMFNDFSGEEEWAFIPQEMLAYQSKLSGGDGKHIYGVDNTITVWGQDFNNNGIIEQPDSDGNYDKVYLYASMRRGPDNSQPSNIYAFDITPGSTLVDKNLRDRITPKLLWVIEGGTGAFTQMGQTWSAPQVATIRIKSGSGSVEKTALIFGGGYDTGVENTAAYPAVDNKVVTKNNPGSSGNAIFMVDAETGARLWWASSGTATDGNGDNSDLQLADMNYPIPSDLALLDSNGDNAIDRIYVGDLGGQLWRIDLDPLIKPSGSNESQRNGSTSGYVYADLICDRASTATGTPATYARQCPSTDDPQEWRRVFYAPDVASVTDTVYIYGSEANRNYDMVFVSTGDRPDPLDRLTAIGLPTTEQPVHNTVYGLKDPDFAYGTVASPPRPITPHGATSDVHDATANLVQVGTIGSGGEQETAFGEIRDRKGWMVNFKESSIPSWTTSDLVGIAEGAGRVWIGEKSLARPVIFGGVIYVSTFTPANPSMVGAACEPNEGLGRIYGLNYLDAKIVIDLDGDGSNERYIDLGGGIPSELVTVIREDGTTGLVGSSGGAATVGVADIGGQERTFWYQE